MAVEVIFCYAHKDEWLLNKLKIQLKPLQRGGLVKVWYDRDISAGKDWEHEIDEHLNTAQIILLLVSPDFIDSEYCYSIEMQRAIERDKLDDVRAIPIILRPTDWHNTPLGKLQALPKDGNPITTWRNRDTAFLDVARGLRKAIEELLTPLSAHLPEVPLDRPQSELMSPSQDTPKREPQQPVPTIAPEAFSLRCTLTGDPLMVLSVAISPDGQTLASGGVEGTIKLWNLKTGRLLHTFIGHKHHVSSVAISPDGQTLASGCHDWKIKLWNLNTRELLFTLEGHSADPMSKRE